MSFGVLLVAVLVVAGIWAWLESREKARVAKGLPRLSGMRLVLGAVFASIAVFSGGCSLVFLGSLLQGPQQYIDVWAVLVIGGIPFAISAMIWWLSMRRPKG